MLQIANKITKYFNLQRLHLFTIVGSSKDLCLKTTNPIDANNQSVYCIPSTADHIITSWLNQLHPFTYNINTNCEDQRAELDWINWPAVIYLRREHSLFDRCRVKFATFSAPIRRLHKIRELHLRSFTIPAYSILLNTIKVKRQLKKTSPYITILIACL